MHTSSLTIEQARDCYIDSEERDLPGEAAQGKRKEAPNSTLDELEFTEALVRIGAQKYGAVGGMSLARCYVGALQNALGLKTEEEVITSNTTKEVARFDPSQTPALPGETAERLQEWVYMWSTLRLTELHGFPAWEQKVNDLLHAKLEPLLSIFAYYSGTEQGEPGGLTLLGSRELALPQWLDLVNSPCAHPTLYAHTYACAHALLPTARTRTALRLRPRALTHRVHSVAGAHP